jgi:hypothetical protein
MADNRFANIAGYFFKAILEAVVLAIVIFFGAKYLWTKYKDKLPEPIKGFFDEIQEFFKKDDVNRDEEFTITAIAGVGGKISPAGESLVKYGDDLLFEFEPFTNYAVVAVSVDGVDVAYDDAGCTYTFKCVKQDHMIRIVFGPTTS